MADIDDLVDLIRWAHSIKCGVSSDAKGFTIYTTDNIPGVGEIKVTVGSLLWYEFKDKTTTELRRFIDRVEMEVEEIRKDSE